MLSFTKYTQSVSFGKCSTIVSNSFNILSFNILRCSNIRLPSELRPTDVGSYIVSLAYIVRPLSLTKSVFPKVVYSFIPTHSCGLAELILYVHNFFTELINFLTLQWLRKIVCNHVSRGTVFNVQFIRLDYVSDEVISNGNILFPFTAGLLTVLLEQNSALVFLVVNCVFDIISLTI